MEEEEKMKVKGKAGKEKGHYNNMNFCQEIFKIGDELYFKIGFKTFRNGDDFQIKIDFLFCFHDKNTLNHVAKITTRL